MGFMTNNDRHSSEFENRALVVQRSELRRFYESLKRLSCVRRTARMQRVQFFARRFVAGAIS